ncbi:DNA cytosine methyltransferase [Patulibacter sp. S7RM1-6]
MSLLAVDLFAGAGGATQGLKQAGYDVRAAVENDPFAAETFRQNHSTSVLFERDVQSVSVEEVATTLPPGSRLDLLKACPPCQGFSTLGKGDKDDVRNDLVLGLERFVVGLRPRTFVFENVPGLATDRRLEVLLDSLRHHGYGVRQLLVDAADFGVPQRRRRLIVLGVADVAEDALPVRLRELLPSTFDCSRRTVREALRGVGPIATTTDRLHRARRPGPVVKRRLEAIPVGGGRFDLPAELRLRCHEGMGRTATSAYGRMHLDQPAPTLTTRCTTPACGRFVHPTEPRGISLREAALLQTFPATYAFAGGHDRVERQIGNAVPVRLAEALGLVASSFVHEEGLER